MNFIKEKFKTNVVAREHCRTYSSREYGLVSKDTRQ